MAGTLRAPAYLCTHEGLVGDWVLEGLDFDTLVQRLDDKGYRRCSSMRELRLPSLDPDPFAHGVYCVQAAPGEPATRQGSTD